MIAPDATVGGIFDEDLMKEEGDSSDDDQGIPNNGKQEDNPVNEQGNNFSGSIHDNQDNEDVSIITMHTGLLSQMAF